MNPIDPANQPLDGLAARLPPITEEEIKKIQTEASSYLAITNAFVEIAGCSREEWLKKVEAHKAKCPRQQGQPS